jgi:ABC-type branched-subunit amino acid transport system substrate-binding protein
MRRLLNLLLLLAILALPLPARAAQAVAPGGQETSVGEERAALEQGLELYRTGQFDAATPLLEEFLSRNPADPDAPRATLALAQMLLQAGNPQQALLYLQRIAEPQRTPELQLVRGQALVATGDAESGRRELLAIDPKPLSAKDRTARLLGLAHADAALGRALEALTFLDQAATLDPDQSAAVLTAGHQLLQGLNEPSLEEVAFMFRGTPLGLDAAVQLAQRAAQRGDTAAARRLLAPVLAAGVDFPYRREATNLYARLTGKPWLQRAIGVLLPLSGKYATFGQLVRRGMELAQEQGADGSSPIQLLFRDIGADPQRSAETVSSLVHEDGVMAIAGPITSAAAAAAAQRAQQEGVPLLSLSQREGLPALGDMVFRDSLTPRLQAEALARYAVEERGLTKFAILLPDNRPGREMADQFTAALTRRGGQVLAREAYPPEATDFRRQIRLLMGKDPDARDEELSKDPLEDLFLPEPPPLPFQALFIPDYADKVGLIAPQLPYYGLEGLPLFGINGWDSPELVHAAGPYVEGAVFVDGFFVHSLYPFVRDFADRYFARYGEEPTILGAQGYDVAGILLGILDDPAVASRDDVRLALQQLRNYPGVTGATSFDQEGEAEKVLFLLQVQNGNIVQIN